MKLLWCILPLLAACSTGLVAASPDGADLYRRHCSVCHQTEGKGGIGLPLTRGKLAQVSDSYLLSTVKLGRPGRIMPSFDFLGEDKITAIVAYVRSWYPDQSMEFEAEPAKGDANQGKALFEANCTQCHGADGSGSGEGTGLTLSRERKFLVMPPAINNSGFLQAAPDGMIKKIVREGRTGSIMPPFKDKFSEPGLNDLVAYVRTLEQAPHQPEGELEPSWVVESPHDFDTTVGNVRAALSGANFRLFPLRFVEEGLTDEFSVNQKQVSIRFCNFSELYSLLNIEPRLGTVLPCQINVVEDAQGRVLLISANVSAIAQWFNNDELIRLGKAMEEIIKAVMEEAVL